MKIKESGFTLIELLAVIVILGLLMAIAIPSITKYITESRKKTYIATAQQYISSAIVMINNLEYQVTDSMGTYYLSIDCISLDKGGKSPFGEWIGAYVVIGYNDDLNKYDFYWTSLDSAGYGVDLTLEKNLTVKSVLSSKKELQIKSLPKKTNDIRVISKNEQGFCATTNMESTITNLSKDLKEDNEVIVKEADFSNSISSTIDESGLYSSTATNGGKQTYFFRGMVNNYVSFAGYTWNIVRINEDGTIRMMMTTGINDDATYPFAISSNYLSNMYYSNSVAKQKLEEWYDENLLQYDEYITIGLFCEQAKVKCDEKWTSGKADAVYYKKYTPNFSCEKDGNGYGPLYLKIGLITYDEVVAAGGYYLKEDKNFYLSSGSSYHTMSPAGYDTNPLARRWGVGIYWIGFATTTSTSSLRPVINLKADLEYKGSGTKDDPYVILTKEI